jgi:adenylate cyclase class 2
MKWGFAMPCEVEVKFPVADPATIRRQLNALGCQWDNHTIEEVDRYFQHPARDFSQTDEALRLRRSDGLAFLTYKGPKIDPGTKTRDEIELPIDPTPEAFAAWQNLLERLGFRPVADVRKKRHRAKVQWQDWVIQVSLDDVESLGWYLELETIVPPALVEQAKQVVLSLAARLGLGPVERRSYLELLLTNRSDKFPPPAEGSRS